MTDYKKNLKALALLLGLALAMPFSAQAQTTKSMYHEGSLMDDPTAKWHSQGLMNDRTTFNALTFTITNNGIGQDETPLGSGLLILGAAGAGYAIAKRRKNKKNNKNGVALMLATLMLLGFTQCKKEVVEPVAEGTTYHISIPVGEGTRAVVDPAGGDGTYATVGFEAGDVIYVGYNNAYVGTITYNAEDGHKRFEGDITTTIEGTQPLHLYFLGGKGFTPTIESNTATVIISDQSSQYPVISYAPTKTNFDGTGSYEAKLLNKCSIMKFNVTTPSTAAVCITGMNNKVTVDFSKVAETGTGLTGSTTDNGFTYSQDGTGVIKMRAKDSDNATWAIVLPQAKLDEGGANSVYSTDGYAGTRPAIHAIESNKYYNSGIAMTIANAVWDGDLAKLTSSSTEEFATARDGMTIYGTLGVNKKVSIADGATVILNGVSINAAGTWASGAYAGITCEGNATIILNGTNTVKGFNVDYPGIHVPAGNTLTIKGSGSLTASSNGHGAGIGGGWDIACGNIEIQGGTVMATGGNLAAGIGSGTNGSCGTITISGGTVRATGGEFGAGIGSGTNGSCGTITISGGNVTAIAGTYGINTAAIGKSSEGTCTSVTFTPDITSLTLTNSEGDDIVSYFINATAVYANATPITSMLSTSVGGAITGEMATAGFATSYDGGTKTWTITKKE